MAVPHAAPGQAVDIRPLASALAHSVTTTLIKTERLEVIRLVLPAGKEIPPHKVSGEITVQCLEGRIAVSALDRSTELGAGEMLYLPGGETHAVKGLENASALVTILL